jgi:hypothetical protein
LQDPPRFTQIGIFGLKVCMPSGNCVGNCSCRIQNGGAVDSATKNSPPLTDCESQRFSGEAERRRNETMPNTELPNSEMSKIKDKIKFIAPYPECPPGRS